YFWLLQQQILLPIACGRADAQEILWRPARYHSVHAVLKNPIYAGAYTYGRSKVIAKLDHTGRRILRQIRRKREDWAVLIRAHHEGYIDWDTYQGNQMLSADQDRPVHALTTDLTQDA